MTELEFKLQQQGYKDLGCVNMMSEEVWQKVQNQIKGYKHRIVNLGRCYNAYVYDDIKVYYTVDSSD